MASDFINKIMSKTNENIILLVGNETDRIDNKAIRLLPYLAHNFPKISFVPWDPTEEIPSKKNDIVLIDVVSGITKTKLFESMKKFSLSPRNTAHDFDVPLSIGILYKLGKLKRVRVIGIPMKQKKVTIIKDLKKILNKIF